MEDLRHLYQNETNKNKQFVYKIQNYLQKNKKKFIIGIIILFVLLFPSLIGSFIGHWVNDFVVAIKNTINF